MGFETPGGQQDQIPPVTAERVAYANERQEPLDASRRERAFLDQETCRECWPDVPDHAADFLRHACPDHFPLAMDEAARIDPAELADPVIAEFLLEDCVTVAEQQAAEAQLRDNAGEIATLDGQIASNYETIADVREERAEVNTDIEGLSDQVALNELTKTDPALKDLRGEALLNALASHPFVQERPELQAYLNGIRSQLNRMRAVVTDPQERQAFESILSVSSFNLGAESNQGVFADVIARVDASDAISEETKADLRASLGVPQVNTGSQAQDILHETRTDENGNQVPVWPEDRPLNVRPGVDMYSDGNQRQYLRAEFNGHITTIDTTGWSGEVVGKYLEALSFVHDVESFGGTGLFHSIYRIDFNLAGDEGFDAHKINQILNIMGKWFGGFEHADGDIRQSGDRQGFIRYMVRLLNKRGTATGFEESQADTDEVLSELQLRNADGSPNWQQIDRLGEFARSTYLSGDTDFEVLRAQLLGNSINQAE